MARRVRAVHHHLPGDAQRPIEIRGCDLFVRGLRLGLVQLPVDCEPQQRGLDARRQCGCFVRQSFSDSHVVFGVVGSHD